MNGLQHQRGHSRLDAIKQACYPGHVAKSDIHPAQAHQNKEGRQDKKRAGHDAAPGAVHQPANVSGELLRLGARQQHAVVQGVKKTPLRYPAFFFHQFAVHDGNLTRRAAKADETQTQPEFEGVSERNRGLHAVYLDKR